MAVMDSETVARQMRSDNTACIHMRVSLRVVDIVQMGGWI